MASVETTQGGSSQKKRATEVIAGSSAAEAVAGLAAIVLAILALVGVMPIYLVSVATITIGVALLISGAGLASQYSALMAALDDEGDAAVSGGMTVQFLGGAAGIALGVLALIGVLPMTLIAVAAIVFGGAMVLGAGSTAQLSSLTLQQRASRSEGYSNTREVARQAVQAAAGTEVLVGLGAAVLGIIVLAGVAGGSSLTLLAIVMLALGATIVLSGAAIGGKMAAMMRRY